MVLHFHVSCLGHEHTLGVPINPCLWALQPPGSTGHERWLAHLPVPQRPVGSKPSVKLVLYRADELSLPQDNSTASAAAGETPSGLYDLRPTERGNHS